MVLGNSLFHARKKAGLTQEEVAERLGVSRQTIGKWEADETLPDIRQSKRLATLYGVTLDELIEFDLDVSQVEEAIERSNEELEEKIDWTSAWAKKYPILAKYQGEVNIPLYARRIRQMFDELKAEHGYSELDAMLVLKDILYGVWKQAKAAGVK
ncbi:helix-turn-helix transcriptional regulator [Collinsella tanakaei]|nr:helix-turn-helix transcriptional regulator [Collinsella tanakaei]